MCPTLFKLPAHVFHLFGMTLNFPGMELNAYPTCMAVAFLVCVLWIVRDAEHATPPLDITPIGGIYAFFGGLVGAKVWWVLQFRDWTELYRALFIWDSGLVFYGGLLGGILATAIYLYINRIPRLLTADIVAPFIALGEAITRIGCFCNGCCWGRVADGVPWGVRFPKYTDTVHNILSLPYWQQKRDGLITDSTNSWSLPVHPTQLYMIFGLTVSFIIMRFVVKKSPFPGSKGLMYLFFYGIVRFTVEIFRGESANSVFGMTVSQAVSMGLVIISATVFLIIWGGVISFRNEESTDQQEEIK